MTAQTKTSNNTPTKRSILEIRSTMESSEIKEFMITINMALEDLIVRHGYSRDRATKFLLQEIARSILPSTINVTDAEVS